MNAKIQFWQWPNILAMDAAVIAIVWLRIFAEAQSAAPGLAAYTVLALSVWLTYIADRLFDAGSRESSQLLSARHRFAKRRARWLWSAWLVLLAVSLFVATTSLSQYQLSRGFVLLFFCLAYTGLNQVFSHRFFPKELLVALIFAGGTQVFLPEFTEWQSLAAFTLLCFSNCLIIAWREKAVDARLEVRSIASNLNARQGYWLLASGSCLSFFSTCPTALLPSILALAFVRLARERFAPEAFRVLCDTALLAGPVLYFLSSGVSGG